MARLHEFQGKALLAGGGFIIPGGRAASTPREARDAAAELGGPCVVKIQAWTTGRAAMGGIVFTNSPAEAEQAAARLLAMKVGQFPVTHVLVEERLDLASELFLSLSVDERERAPVLLLAAGGGSGVEERAATVRRVPCDVHTGPAADALSKAVADLPIASSLRAEVAAAARRAFEVAKASDARSLEINPLAITKDGRLVAADCRITIDDYAVFRHPELGIDFARELDHPPTPLEKVAYAIEQADHRGTFFFAQMNTEPAQGSKGLVGFHGAGGGGSMMSMDALTNEGFTIANFTDTSGNPSPAKVYRAARIILSQPGLIGYFGSGSGVANQEQYWSAYGLAKAFWELNLDLPTVIRLGGNTEDRAVDILQGACRAANLPARVEGYRKSDPPAKIAARFAALVTEAKHPGWKPRPPRRPDFVGSSTATKFEVKGGRVWIDQTAWKKHAPAIMARANGLLKDHAGSPAITAKPDEFLTKDSDMIACEVECRRDEIDGVFVELDIPGLDAAAASHAGGAR
jgi:succinyl-CoA synthetase beta subunit